jgi:hypothetical protein
MPASACASEGTDRLEADTRQGAGGGGGGGSRSEEGPYNAKKKYTQYGIGNPTKHMVNIINRACEIIRFHLWPGACAHVRPHASGRHSSQPRSQVQRGAGQGLG